MNKASSFSDSFPCKCRARTRVIDSRTACLRHEPGMRRRRICENGHRFSTIERFVVTGNVQSPVERILHLTLKKQWFDLIASGVKVEEYREMKPYWNKALARREYGQISFRNGYASNAPQMLVELLGMQIGRGNPEWGAPSAHVHILKLGAIISTTNIKGSLPSD